MAPGFIKTRIRVSRLSVAVLLIIIWMTIRILTAPVSLSGNVTVIVPHKSSTSTVSQILLQKKLIRNAFVFKIYAKITNFEGKIKAGRYRFSGIVSLTDIKGKLTKGLIETDSFTIPEGYTFEQIANLLARKGLVNKEKFLKIAQNTQFLYKYLPPPGKAHRLEGFLFPDTYFVTKGFSEEQIIKMMLARFDQVFEQEWRKRAAKMNMTVLETVTLASIIEREARVPVDRPLVSSVFHNRLKNDMYLESCATVQYVLKNPKKLLLYRDLKIKSPYNTYLNEGLPPGPIASPGKESLKAALYPAQTNYLYFVAKKDGSHYFSRTLAEHIQAKRKYLK